MGDAISDLRTAKNGSLLWSEDIVELNKQISDIASQERLLAQLKQQGVIDPDIFISRSNLLAERRRELKLKKERILHAEEDHTIQQTQELIGVLECSPDWLEAYVDNVATVNGDILYSNQRSEAVIPITYQASIGSGLEPQECLILLDLSKEH